MSEPYIHGTITCPWCRAEYDLDPDDGDTEDWILTDDVAVGNSRACLSCGKKYQLRCFEAELYFATTKVEDTP